MLKFRCKNCDQKIGVPDDWRGHIVRCPRCKQGVDVPSNAEFVNKPPPPPRKPKNQTEASAPVGSPAAMPTTSPIPVELANAPALDEPKAFKASIATPSEPLTFEAPAPKSIGSEPAENTTLTFDKPTTIPIEFDPPIPIVPEIEPTPVHAATVVSPPTVPLEAAPFEPVVLEPTAAIGMTSPVDAGSTDAVPTSSTAKASEKTADRPARTTKRSTKKTKTETKPPAAAPEAIEAAQPVEPPAQPLTEAKLPEVASDDPSVVVVTVARRDEVEPSPLTDLESGKVVNIAEVLTSSVATPKPIVTSAPPSDFASVFSSGAEPTVVPPIIDVEIKPEPQPTIVEVKAVEPATIAPEPEPIIASVSMDAAVPFAGSESQDEPFVDEELASQRALSEIVDVLPGEHPAASESPAATDLLDTLARKSLPPDGPRAERVELPTSRRRAAGVGAEEIRGIAVGRIALSLLAMLAAAASLALCVSHSKVSFALPAGVLAMLLAVIATALAQGRSALALVAGIGAAAASMVGVGLSIAIGLGLVPGSPAYARRELAKHLPSARAGEVEVRVRSAEVLHPVLLKQKKLGPTAETTDKTVLRVEVELKNTSDHDARYTSWSATSANAEPVRLQDEEGNPLKSMIAVGAVPVGQITGETVNIKPRGGTVGDVLLFEAPPTQTRELDLQLPGANVGSAQPLQLHIPAEMFARQ